MVVVIKKEDTAEVISKKPKKFSTKAVGDKQVRLSKYFGVLKLEEDVVALQRRWRDEW